MTGGRSTATPSRPTLIGRRGCPLRPAGGGRQHAQRLLRRPRPLRAVARPTGAPRGLRLRQERGNGGAPLGAHRGSTRGAAADLTVTRSPCAELDVAAAPLDRRRRATPERLYGAPGVRRSPLLHARRRAAMAVLSRSRWRAPRRSWSSPTRPAPCRRSG